jgi:hypothetical protein
LGGGCYYQASTDQAQMDTIVPILSGGLLAIAFATTGILVVMVGVTWQLIFIIIPLSWIYYSYQVSTQQIKSLFIPSFLPLASQIWWGYCQFVCFWVEGIFFYYLIIN